MFGFGKSSRSSNKNEPASIAAATVQVPQNPSPLGRMNDQLLQQIGTAQTTADSALNDQIVQAVRVTNQEVAAQAAVQIAVPADLMISQASGLMAQSAAAYFDGVSKVALASKAYLLKEMTENIAQQKLGPAAEDALGALMADLLVGSAAAVAAAAGAMEAESASFALDKINQSISNYQDLFQKRQPAEA